MLNESQRATAHDLVKRALAQAVSKGRETPMPSDEPAAKEAPFNERFGVFVTLHDASGDLRGCIGNILPVATLAEGLWGRAQDAALNDPRFDPVTPAELSSLSIEISVLSRPVPVASPNDIEIGKHGILLKKRGRSAVFLPQVAPEQGWNLETTLQSPRSQSWARSWRLARRRFFRSLRSRSFLIPIPLDQLDLGNAT